MLALHTHNHRSTDPVNALLNEWTRMWPTATPTRQATLTQKPRLAAREHQDRHEIFAAVPGLKKTDLIIEVVDRALVLKRVVEKGNQETPVTPFAISKGFEHRLSLPEDGDLSKISAHLESGILTIIIPKKAEPVPTSIEISGS